MTGMTRSAPMFSYGMNKAPSRRPHLPQGTATGIGAIAVAQGRRGEPFGELVLRILLDKAQTLAGDPILARLRPEEIPLIRAVRLRARSGRGGGTISGAPGWHPLA